MTPASSDVAAWLTPPAPGAVAVVGLAGPGVDVIASHVLLTRAGRAPTTLPLDRPMVSRLHDAGTVLDDVIVLRGNTVDGVPTVELCVHGGVRVAQRTLMLLEREGAAIIEPWEWHRRISGVDPIDADVDRALARCTARRLVEWLVGQRERLPAFLRAWPEHNDAVRADYRRRSAIASRLVDGLSVVLVGPPNAGKSTLANRLIGRPRVITSPLAGTTRDWVAETALIDGWPVELTDTAGLRETNCVIEAEAIRRGGERARSADAVVVLLDATATDDVLRESLAGIVRELPQAVARLVVLNKCDVGAGRVAGDVVRLSASTGEGVPEFERRLVSLLELDRLEEPLPAGFLPHHLPADV